MGAKLPVYLRTFEFAEQICCKEVVVEHCDVFDPLQQFKVDPQRQREIAEGRAMFRFVAGGIIWVKRLNECN